MDRSNHDKAECTDEGVSGYRRVHTRRGGSGHVAGMGIVRTDCMSSRHESSPYTIMSIITRAMHHPYSCHWHFNQWLLSWQSLCQYGFLGPHAQWRLVHWAFKSPLWVLSCLHFLFFSSPFTVPHMQMAGQQPNVVREGGRLTFGVRLSAQHHMQGLPPQSQTSWQKCHTFIVSGCVSQSHWCLT
jgi:hypothetical protein